MKSSRGRKSPPVIGEVLPPKPEPATYEELAVFLTAHGREVPRPPSYSSLEQAMQAIIANEVRAALK
jgi:hypothetical protein